MYTPSLRLAAIAIFSVCLVTACRKELPQVRHPETGLVNSYTELFDRFWNTMNNNYQFWDKDTMNWDAVYKRYRPLFAKLDINNENDQFLSVGYFNAMLSGVLDGHLFLDFNTPALAGTEIYPRLSQDVNFKNPLSAKAEAQRTFDYFSFVYYDIDAANYLDPGSVRGVYADPYLNQVDVLEGTIHHNVLYFGFDVCSLTSALNDAADNALASAYRAFSKDLQNNPAIKMAIIDMRGNGGGNGNDATILASSMIDKPLFRGTLRYKSGPGRLDYTPWAATYINPAPGAKPVNVPVIILTDVLTFSGAEDITTALHAIPGAVTVGTATRGGASGNNGVLGIQGRGTTDFQTAQGSFMTLYMSPCAYKYIDGSQPLWGLKPDYEVPFDTLAIKAGRDLQLEKALSLMQGK